MRHAPHPVHQKCVLLWDSFFSRSVAYLLPEKSEPLYMEREAAQQINLILTEQSRRKGPMEGMVIPADG